jgi:prolyl oligopeptidase
VLAAALASSVAGSCHRHESRKEPSARAPAFDYPATRRENVAEVLHGVTIADPYRWLEGEDDEVAAWSEQQDKRARRQLDSLTAAASLWDEIAGLWRRVQKPAEVRRGSSAFYLTSGSLFMRTPARGEEALVDGKSLDAGVRITDFVVSPDGSRIAVEFSKNGADMRTLRVFDVRLRALDEGIGGIESSGLVWAGRGFFYTFTPADVPHAVRFGERRIRYHVPGRPQTEDRDAVPPTHDENDSDAMNPLSATEDGASLLVRSRGSWVHRTYALVNVKNPAWPVRPLADSLGEIADVCIRGASLFASVRRSDGGFEIERVAPATMAMDVLDHADAQLVALKPVGPYLMLARSEGATVRSRFYDSRFQLVGEHVSAPGTTESYSADSDGERLVVDRQGLRVPPERVEYDLKTGSEARIAVAPVEFDSDAFAVDEIEATSRDGTHVPITVLRRRDAQLDGSAPLWAYGYGGFRVSAEQIFFPPWVVWARHGGVFASCHIRGGLEYGEPWHEAGSKHNRQSSLDDFAACLSELHRRGYSSAQRTLTQGWSHGAMTVSAVAIQHPDLQRVVLATVPLADMIRFPLFGRGGVGEYGDPENADDFAAVLAFSPYHNVRDGVAYPSFLITASQNDERALPVHARKLAAALQHSSTGGEVLLKFNWGAGHHGGGVEDANRIFAEAMAYAMRMFGGSVGDAGAAR